jgi:polysaccharide biosynthesis protein PslE
MTFPTPATQQVGPESNLRSLLLVFFKHQTKILTILMMSLITVLISFLFIVPVFEANALLLIKVGREYMQQPEVGNSSNNVMVVNRDEIKNSTIAIIHNRDVIERVIASIGLGVIYPRFANMTSSIPSLMEAAITDFSTALTVEGLKNSNVISISFLHPNPQIATQALSLLIEFFKEKHLEIFSTPQSSFLEQQLAGYLGRLRDSEGAINAFKQQSQIHSVVEQRDLLLKQQFEIDTIYKNTQIQIEELQKKVVSLQGQLLNIAQDKKRYTLTDQDQGIGDAQTRLLGLQLKEQELLAKDYREDSRLVGNVRKEIQVVQKFLNAQQESLDRKMRTANPVYQEVEKEMLKAEAELSSKQAGAITLAQQLEQLESEIQAIDHKEYEFRNLQRSLKTNETNYMTYVEKYEDARISEDLNRQNISNITIIQPPTTPGNPLPSKRPLKLILGFMFGLLTGLGYAFFSELTSQSFSTPEQIERRLRLPVLCSISLKQT